MDIYDVLYPKTGNTHKYMGWFKALVQFLMRLLGKSFEAEIVNNF
jgi:hypothetical protein